MSSTPTLRLSREGIFPITRDASGRDIATATGLSQPGTVQGEGKLCGVPSLFVRLQGCNLRCAWRTADGSAIACDTAHTWAADGGHEMSVADILRTLESNMGNMRHVVITGGEPCLQREGMRVLLTGLKERGIHTTIETNGTVDSPELYALASLVSISPKLSASSIGDAALRASTEGTLSIARQAKRDGFDIQIKFVVSAPSDADEIRRDYAETLAILEPSDIFVMPLGATPAQLERSTPAALDMAIANGWRLCNRLHIALFGNKEGT